MEVDRDSSIPLYYQLKNVLLEKIQDGTYGPGDKIPPEHVLAERYGVSRPTVRKTLSVLDNEGYLVKKQGMGTYVQEKQLDNNIFRKLTSFTEELVSQDLDFTTKVLTKELRRPSDLIQQKLSLEEQDRILYLERIRYVDGEPIYFSQSHLTYKFCKGLKEEDLERNSLYKILKENYDTTFTKAEIKLKATTSDPHESEVFEIDEGSPLHFLEGLVFNEELAPFDFYWTRYKADINQFYFELDRSNESNNLFYLIDKEENS